MLAEQELVELRAENRHLLNLLLKQNGHLGVGEQPAQMPKRTPPMPMWKRAQQLEAQAWAEYEGSVNAAQSKGA